MAQGFNVDVNTGAFSLATGTSSALDGQTLTYTLQCTAPAANLAAGLTITDEFDVTYMHECSAAIDGTGAVTPVAINAVTELGQVGVFPFTPAASKVGNCDAAFTYHILDPTGGANPNRPDIITLTTNAIHP